MVKDILFRFLRIIALTLYTLLGASFASDKSPLGGCTNVGTPEIKTFRDFASFACKESWKVHLVNIVRCVDYVEYPDSKRVVHYEAHAQWLDDEKFASSIWGYIRNTIARYAPCRLPESASVFCFGLLLLIWISRLSSHPLLAPKAQPPFV